MPNNQYINKVTLGDRTLMDISDTNIDEDRLPLGSVIYNARGERVTGTAVVYDIYRDTTANWNSKTTFVPNANDIIIYTDHSIVETGNDPVYVPGVKIGDGNAYVVDLPFIADNVAQELLEHTANNISHVTAQERQFWNNKINYNINGEELQFTRM